MIEWEWYTDGPTFKLFIHCLLMANYEDKKWRGIEIKRGSFVTSYAKLANETGLSIRQIRTSLDRLISTCEVTKEATSEFTLINVVNYGVYQGYDVAERQSKRQAKRQASDKPSTSERQQLTIITKKQDNDYDNDNSAGALFEEHNFFTNKLLKDGFIHQNDELYSYDSLFEDLLKTEAFIDVAKATEYVKGKMKNKTIKNTFGYFKTAIQNQLEYVPEAVQDQTSDSVSQEDISDEELRKMLKNV